MLLSMTTWTSLIISVMHTAQTFPPQSHDENGSVKFKGLADEIVGKQKVLEKLLSSLPSVPGVVEDEELEERLKRLREDEPEAIKVEDEFLEYKAFVEKIMTPI